MNKRKVKKQLNRIWYFIWEDNSIWSWIVNIVLAFVLIKFIVYPGLGFLLTTSHPVVAVVSSSMEHSPVKSCIDNKPNELFQSCDEYQFVMCGKLFEEKRFYDLSGYWEECGSWYETNTNIDKNIFSKFSFKNGFNKGDIMFLVGRSAESIETGDVIVFRSQRSDPIIHRVVKKTKESNTIYFQTKGDNNKESIKNTKLDETKINENIIIGKAIIRVPLLGYIKIWFVSLLELLNIA